MKIQILGTGCAKCKKLAENADVAAKELDLSYELVKVTDLNEIMKFGVMMTPALAVDGKVLLTGKVPEPAAIKQLLEKAK
ncbi:MAG TPA: thioredoxin family protein [Candidatus Ozemobacteraceae bacterium]|nr:thioredoxin family protein [Candidatus Ozemobacteraceae bacterium]